MTLLLMCTVDRGLGRGGLSEHPVLHTHTHTHTRMHAHTPISCPTSSQMTTCSLHNGAAALRGVSVLESF